MYNGNSYLIS